MLIHHNIKYIRARGVCTLGSRYNKYRDACDETKQYKKELTTEQIIIIIIVIVYRNNNNETVDFYNNYINVHWNKIVLRHNSIL